MSQSRFNYSQPIFRRRNCQLLIMAFKRSSKVLEFSEVRCASKSYTSITHISIQLTFNKPVTIINSIAVQSFFITVIWQLHRNVHRSTSFDPYRQLTTNNVCYTYSLTQIHIACTETPNYLVVLISGVEQGTSCCTSVSYDSGKIITNKKMLATT